MTGKRKSTYQNNLNSSTTGNKDHFSGKFIILSYPNYFEARLYVSYLLVIYESVCGSHFCSLYKKLCLKFIQVL
jgi:hypothetical protein